MPEPGVAFAQVNKQFGDVHAVRDLTFDVDEGEFLVLVGPSGCGKTTALRMIAGLEDLTSGEIRIAGQPVNHVPPRDRDIAMVFQSYALYPHMTVFDNLAFGLKQRRTPKAEIEARVTEAAAILDLGQLLKRRPRELSGGQRQRVALGRAIVRKPKVFLMDEPLSNLDAQLRVRTRGELSALHRRLATTFIYVTHDQVEAMTMGTRIAVMKDGVLQQLDTPRTLYERPANTFVATFIGSPAMNMLEGELVRSGDDVCFVNPALQLPLPGELVQGVNGAKRVTLGIRPEQFDRRLANHVNASASGDVELVEPHGSDLFVTIALGESRLTARVDPDLTVAPGERVQVSPLLKGAHLFDGDSGVRLG
ncbi:MAG TPA: sn-glycerol-3-phosphate ABC transporter ATP-binding protein UgpC [Tepidiformaceae bacterium]|nr:sn-glycerol-3-phosphate ABC transporter ATP-binding protein UgpC [Tepidiformaceae bacterium]